MPSFRGSEALDGAVMLRMKAGQHRDMRGESPRGRRVGLFENDALPGESGREEERSGALLRKGKADRLSGRRSRAG